jgi:hypothetical protein
MKKMDKGVICRLKDIEKAYYLNGPNKLEYQSSHTFKIKTIQNASK